MAFQDSKQLPEQIAQHLADKIIHLELKPGEKLLEEKLSGELGVSRSPVREAFYILNQWYLVDLVPRRGTFVTEFSEHHVNSLYDILGSLYALINRKASRNFRRENFKELEDILARLEKNAASSNVEEFQKTIFEYACVFLRAANNPLLEKVLRGLWPSKMRIEYAVLRHVKNLPEIAVAFREATAFFQERKFKLTGQMALQYVEQERALVLQYLKEIQHSR
jgi:DNA-binding GntR family transcriptional regulator